MTKVQNNEFFPKVSIVIPVYNGSNYVKEAIDSALSQTYKNIEIIVINDGSNDRSKTDKICKSYGNRIRYFKKENGGVASALNMGIEKMEGEYFSWLSHDDVYYPEKVEKQIKSLSKLEDKKTIIYSGYDIIDENSNFVSRTDFKTMYQNRDLNKSLYPFFNLILNGCSMLISKSLVNENGGFNESLLTTQDYDLWFRLLRKNKILYDGQVFLKSRSHDKQASKASIENHISECNKFWLNIFSLISREEMVELEGSVIDFYKRMYTSFKNKTLYNKVISYLDGKILEESVIGYDNLKEELIKEKLLREISSKIYGNEEKATSLEELIQHSNKEEKRIIFFTENWHDRGGLNRMISVISSLLVKKYEVIVCCLRENGNSNGYPLEKKVKFIEIDSSEFLLFPKLLRILRADILIGSNNCFLPFINMYEEMESLGTRVIMWNHESFFMPFDNLEFSELTKIRKQVYKKVTANIWLSDINAIVAKQFCENVFVIKNPIIFEKNEGINDIPKNSNLISVARFDSPFKRIDRLIKVFANVIREDSKTKLYIVGKYDLKMKFEGEETIGQLIDRLDIPKDRIIFTGEVKDVENYYKKASINILSSEREGFGLTVLEAAQFGLPSIVFEKGGQAEIITDGIDGYIIEDGNLEKMSEMILTLLKNGKKYSKMSMATKKMSKIFSKTEVLNKWMQLLEPILNNNCIEWGGVLKEESNRLNELSNKHIKTIVNSYEEAIDRRNEIALVGTEEVLFSKLAIPFKKIARLLVLFRVQGFKITTRNILLKAKEILLIKKNE